MLPRLLLLFTVVPLIELALLAYVSQYIGILKTIGLVIVTGILGAALARREGVRCWDKIKEKLAAGQAPGAELIEGPMILLAGAFLITPGVLTDLCGLLLLVRPIRKMIARRLAVRFRSQFTIQTPNGFASNWTSDPESIDDESSKSRSGDEIIDVTFIDPEGHEKES